MAYTSVIPVRRLDRTVDYVQNKEKTTPKSLEEAVDYAANRDKTESADWCWSAKSHALHNHQRL